MPIATVAPPNLPAPTVPFFQAGSQPAGPDFYAWWYLNAAFFQQRSVFRAIQNSTTTPIANDGLPHTIQYDDVLEDQWGGWDAVNFRWKPKISGQYQITVTAFMQPMTSQSMLIPSIGGTYTPRGAVVSACNAHNGGAEGTWTVYLVGGQSTVSGAATQLNGTGTVNTADTAGQQSSIEIVWLSN